MSEQTATAIADLIACQEGWACKTIMGAHLDASDDLEDHVDALTGNYTADIEEAFNRFYSVEDILFYSHGVRTNDPRSGLGCGPVRGPKTTYIPFHG